MVEAEVFVVVEVVGVVVVVVDTVVVGDTVLVVVGAAVGSAVVKGIVVMQTSSFESNPFGHVQYFFLQISLTSGDLIKWIAAQSLDSSQVFRNGSANQYQKRSSTLIQTSICF
jgi:hypothetical protein